MVRRILCGNLKIMTSPEGLRLAQGGLMDTEGIVPGEEGPVAEPHWPFQDDGWRKVAQAASAS